MSFGKLLAGNIVYRSLNIVVSIFNTILLTRLMSAGGYGLLSLMIVNASIFSLVTCLGSESGITYQFASGKMERGKVFSIIYSIIFFHLFLLVLTEFIHFKITGHYWLTGGKELKFLLWGIIYLFSITIIDKYIAFLNGSHLYTLANKIIFFSNLIGLCILGWLYFFHEPKEVIFYVQVFIATTFLPAVSLIFFFHRLSKQPLIFLGTGRMDWKVFFSYSLTVFITNVIQFLAYRVDYWLVDFYKGTDTLGLYSLAVKMGQLFWVLPILFASIIFPRVADKQLNYDVSKFLTLLRVTNTFSLCLMLLAAFLSGWAIPFFFGDIFSNSVKPFLYLLPGIFMFSINIMLAAYFAGKSNLSVNLIGSAICLVLVIILDVWLIPLYGIYGAAIATSIAYTFSALYSLRQFTKTEKKSVLSLLFVKGKDLLLIRELYKKNIG